MWGGRLSKDCSNPKEESCEQCRELKATALSSQGERRAVKPEIAANLCNDRNSNCHQCIGASQSPWNDTFRYQSNKLNHFIYIQVCSFSVPVPWGPKCNLIHFMSRNETFLASCATGQLLWQWTDPPFLFIHPHIHTFPVSLLTHAVEDSGSEEAHNITPENE